MIAPAHILRTLLPVLQDVVGLVPSSHTGQEQEQQDADKGMGKGKSKSKGKGGDKDQQLAPGERVVGVVLDVVPHQGLVELSLKEELKRAAKDGKVTRMALKRLEVGTGRARPCPSASQSLAALTAHTY